MSYFFELIGLLFCILFVYKFAKRIYFLFVRVDVSHSESYNPSEKFILEENIKKKELEIVQPLRKIGIYVDKGASSSCIKYLVSLFSKIRSHYKIEFIKANDLINQNFSGDAIIFPGGADLPYLQALSGKGNSFLTSYVQNGGKYIGICAGAYYGSSYIEFAKGTDLEVTGPRELNFKNAKCIGPFFGYEYNSEKYATLANVEILKENNKKYKIWINGGGIFTDLGKNDQVICNLISKNTKYPVIIKTKVGMGEVLLSAIHFEYGKEYISEFNLENKIEMNEINQNELDRIEFSEYIFKTINI